MQTYTLKVRTDTNGVLKIEVPTDVVDGEVELVLVVQPTEKRPKDEMNSETEIPPAGTGSRMAYEAQRAGIVIEDGEDVMDTMKLLRDDFADDLLGRFEDDESDD